MSNWGLRDTQEPFPTEGNENAQDLNDANDHTDNTHGHTDVDASVTKKGDPLAEIRVEIEKAGWTKPEVYDYSSMTGVDNEYKWSSAGRVYCWDGQEGDLGPEYKDLEDELFGPEKERRIQTGHDLTALVSIDI
jgi:hypothetical protein